jgi:pantothenate kinase
MELLPLFDDTWFIDCDLDVAMERVLQRQIADGRDLDVARRRVETNDRPNAELIAKTRGLARVIVPSRPFRNVR